MTKSKKSVDWYRNRWAKQRERTRFLADSVRELERKLHNAPSTLRASIDNMLGGERAQGTTEERVAQIIAGRDRLIEQTARLNAEMCRMATILLRLKTLHPGQSIPAAIAEAERAILR